MSTVQNVGALVRGAAAAACAIGYCGSWRFIHGVVRHAVFGSTSGAADKSRVAPFTPATSRVSRVNHGAQGSLSASLPCSRCPSVPSAW